MEMAERERQRVGGVGRGCPCQPEPQGDAAADGALVSLAVADGGELDGRGRVLVERDARRAGGREDGAARLAETERALHVARDEVPLEHERGR